MSTTPWSSAYCLSRFNQFTGRPNTSPSTDAITDEQKYVRLSEAQNELVGDLAGICPHVLYPNVADADLPTLSTDDNQVFTFGFDDDDNAIEPIGKAQLYRNLNDIPSNPMAEGRDFLNEGAHIRIPNNGTYTGTIYWRGIAPPPTLTANTDPILLPAASRELIVLRAAISFSMETKRNPELAVYLQGLHDKRWGSWLVAWRTMYRGGGVLGTWTGMQIALGNQFSPPII